MFAFRKKLTFKNTFVAYRIFYSPHSRFSLKICCGWLDKNTQMHCPRQRRGNVIACANHTIQINNNIQPCRISITLLQCSQPALFTYNATKTDNVQQTDRHTRTESIKQQGRIKRICMHAVWVSAWMWDKAQPNSNATVAMFIVYIFRLIDTANWFSTLLLYHSFVRPFKCGTFELSVSVCVVFRRLVARARTLPIR